jgi:hypothetical protein
MPPFDFKVLLTAAPEQQLVKDHNDAAWADFGRRVHANLMDERFVKAVVTAQLAAVSNGRNEPVQHGIARRIRAFILSGAITR